MEREFNDMKDVFKVLPTTQEENEYMIVIGKHLATTEKFPTREAAEEKICYELDEDVITKKYIFTKQKRRLICEKTYDKDLEDLKKWNHKQLKLF